MERISLAVIIGNRNFFPDVLVTEGRRDILRVFAEMDFEPIILAEEDTNLGGVETWEDVKKCADLFKANRDRIDGILVVLPNFGDERAVADTIKLSGLQVPILVQAYPDDLKQFNLERRRDAFCGKISVCNNLRQYGYPFSLTKLHTVNPIAAGFKTDLSRFIGVCRVVNGLKNARLGAVGARPGAFNTVRFSEKLLQVYGIGVITMDLSEVFGDANKLADRDPKVRAKLEEIKAYVPTEGVPASAMEKMAKLGVVLDGWTAANDLDATAIQCWSSIQQNYGVNACGLMSMMSEKLMPCACEVDITGAVSMYALQLASGKPSALLDWNNNYGDDPNKGVIFHCSNLPKAFFTDIGMDYQEIIAGSVGKENTYGTVVGRIRTGPFTYCRVSTDDERGVIRAYLGEGQVTDDPVETFGGYGAIEIPNFQRLLHHICENGYEHHVAVNLSQCASAVNEALSKYMGWDVYYHGATA